MTTKIKIKSYANTASRIEVKEIEVEATYIPEREAHKNCARLGIAYASSDFLTAGMDLIVYQDRETGRYFYTTRLSFSEKRRNRV